MKRSDSSVTSDFDQLQQKLGSVYAINTPESTTPHVMVLMSSFSLGETFLSHYRSRLPALEHRFLVGVLMLRMPAARMVYLCSQEPDPAVVDHYLSLLPASLNVRERLLLVVVDDDSPRPIAAKLLDRPDLLDRIGEWIGDDPAFIEPWNVAEPERQLALALGLPINGSAPDLWPLGFKSAGRKLFRDAGVPIPPGREDLTTVSNAVDAIEQLRSAQPGAPAVILKHDDSAAGDGNAVIPTDDLEPPGTRAARRRLRSRVNSLEPWYLDELEKGFVAESRIVGDQFSSPSAQVEIRPDGSAVVLSTHEQILGDDGQVYLGCRFPADPSYAPALGAHAFAAARVLGERGARGRAGIDFVTARSGSEPWSTYAIEINLRKPGTTHPYSVLRHLAPGRYDMDTGRYTDDTGTSKYYVASDNLMDENWTGIPEADVLAAFGRAGISFDPPTRTGVVPHMLSCLAIDGRFGVTAIADSAAHADNLQEATIFAMHDLAATFG
ncbi:MAG: peptide ligase PGM1-related protein [Acidimicrobiales bacterium]